MSPRRSTGITPTRRSLSRSAPSTSGGASSPKPPARPRPRASARRSGASRAGGGGAVGGTARGYGFRVFRGLTGHGIGRAMHEDPRVFNWAAPQATDVLEPGLVITIEPMVAGGGTRLLVERDGWTV